MEPLKIKHSQSESSIQSNTLAMEGKKLLNSSLDEGVVDQKVKDFVADSKNIAVLFNRKPLDRAQSVMSPAERIGCFVGGGALVAVSALGIGAIIGGIVVAAVLLPIGLLPFLIPIVIGGSMLGMVPAAVVGWGAFAVFEGAFHQAMATGIIEIDTWAFSRTLSAHDNSFGAMSQETKDAAIELYKQGLMQLNDDRPWHDPARLSSELFALEIRGNPALSKEEKETLIQQYMDHQVQVQVYSSQLVEKDGPLEKQLIVQYRATTHKEPSSGDISYLMQSDLKAAKSNVRHFWSGQAERLASSRILLEKIQNEEVRLEDKIRLIDNFKRDFNALQKDFARPPQGLSDAWEARYTNYIGDLAALQSRYDNLLGEAKNDALFLQKIESEKSLSSNQRQILQEGFLAERENFHQKSSMEQVAEKSELLRNHYQYLVDQLKLDKEFLAEASHDPKLNELDRTQFPLVYRQTCEALAAHLAKELPLSWLNPEAEQLYRSTFEEMRNHWEKELLLAETWDSQSIDVQSLIRQFPELGHAANKDYLEQVLNSKNSYFTRIGIIENTVKRVRDLDAHSAGNLLKKKDKVRLESVATTPWERLLLIEEAAHQQTWRQLVNCAQGLTVAQMELILRKGVV